MNLALDALSCNWEMTAQHWNRKKTRKYQRLLRQHRRVLRLSQNQRFLHFQSREFTYCSIRFPSSTAFCTPKLSRWLMLSNLLCLLSVIAVCFGVCFYTQTSSLIFLDYN